MHVLYRKHARKYHFIFFFYCAGSVPRNRAYLSATSGCDGRAWSFSYRLSPPRTQTARFNVCIPTVCIWPAVLSRSHCKFFFPYLSPIFIWSWSFTHGCCLLQRKNIVPAHHFYSPTTFCHAFFIVRLLLFFVAVWMAGLPISPVSPALRNFLFPLRTADIEVSNCPELSMKPFYNRARPSVTAPPRRQPDSPSGRKRLFPDIHVRELLPCAQDSKKLLISSAKERKQKIWAGRGWTIQLRWPSLTTNIIILINLSRQSYH